MFKNWIKKKISSYFYSFMVEVIKDEIEILCFLFVNGKKVTETNLKHLPSNGMYLEVCFSLMDERVFLIEKVTISPIGAVLKLEGKFIV